MATYEYFKPYEKMENPLDAFRIYSKQTKIYKTKLLCLLKRFEVCKSLPSFLIRTLHDYVSGETRLSQYQRIIINLWEQSGLGKPAAGNALYRFYSIGQELFSYLDFHYFSEPTSRLDRRFKVDATKLDWSKYFTSDGVLSPIRLSEALRTSSMKNLTIREKDFAREIMRINKKRSWRTFTQDYKAATSLQCIIKEPLPRYYIADRKSGKVLKLSDTQFRIADNRSNYLGKDISNKALEEFFIQEEAPSKELACFDLWLYRLGHKIDEYSEVTGDDPVFVYSAYVLSETAPPEIIAGPEVYIPKDDEIHTNFRSNIKRIYPELAGNILYNRENLFHANETLILMVDAIEDDDWFSDETEEYIDFGFRTANAISSLDPTGITGVIVAIGELAWEVVKLFDKLDDDDYIGRSMYFLYPNILPEDSSNYPWSREWDLIFRKGDDLIWRFRIKNEVKTAIFT